MGNCDGTYELAEERQKMVDDSKIYVKLKKKEGAVKYFGTDVVGNFVIILYDKTAFKLDPNSALKDKLILDKRFEFVYYKDEDKVIVDIKPPQVHSFRATVAGIWPMDAIDPECNVDDDPIYDIVDSVAVMRYELYFLSGGPRKMVYVLDGMQNDLEIGLYYNFYCVLDDADRTRWLRVITIEPITEYRNMSMADIQRIRDGQYAYDQYMKDKTRGKIC